MKSLRMRKGGGEESGEDADYVRERWWQQSSALKFRDEVGDKIPITLLQFEERQIAIVSMQKPTRVM
jgi:hypothetical protein